MGATISKHFLGRSPSPIRQAQILFAQRPDRDEVEVINLAIGNVSLPMHPAMQHRMQNLTQQGSPFEQGVVRYTPSVGTDEARKAFKNILASAVPEMHPDIDCVVTDGGSQAMELMILGVCGPKSERPLLLLDPAYTNYNDMAKRLAVDTVSIRRELQPEGTFSLPDVASLTALIKRTKPTALVIIPADNPTGHFMPQRDINELAQVCVDHDMWLVSDEAYRQLQYDGQGPSSVWNVAESDVPGITGRRISIESASKVWNACGLRIGALVTDNPELHRRAVAEYTANLSANAIGQYIFGALAHESKEALDGWYQRQRDYYAQMMQDVAQGLRQHIDGVVVSNPKASLYSVIDLRNVAPVDFDAAKFVAFCAERGKVDHEGQPHTVLVSPMGGFYGERLERDPSRFQMRLAFVESPEKMAKVPAILAALLKAYLAES